MMRDGLNCVSLGTKTFPERESESRDRDAQYKTQEKCGKSGHLR